MRGSSFLSHTFFVTLCGSYTSQLVEQALSLVVAAVSKIECINACGVRQLLVDLDYVANCCR